MTLEIGPFVSGETPAPLTYAFLDDTGVPLPEVDDTWTGVFRWWTRGSDPVENNVTVSSTAVATYPWAAGDISVVSTSVFKGEITITDGTQTYVSERIQWVVYSAIPAPAP